MRPSTLTERCTWIVSRSTNDPDLWCTRYFEGGVSSVFLWDLDDGGFAGVVLLKKSKLVISVCYRTLIGLYFIALPAPSPNEPSGSWDSIHVFEANERGRTAHYKLTSTVMLQLKVKGEASGEVDLSGSMTRQVSTPTLWSSLSFPLIRYLNLLFSKRRIDHYPTLQRISQTQGAWWRRWSLKCAICYRKSISARHGT